MPVALKIPVIRIMGDPAPAAVSAVVLNCPRAMVCVPLTAVLIELMLTNSTLPLSFWNTDPATNALAGVVLYHPRVNCNVVPLVTS